MPEKKKGNPVAGLIGLVVIVAIPIIAFASCGSHDNSSASATAAPSSSRAAPAPTSAAARPATDQTYLAVLRIAGVPGTDDELLTDGLSTCMDFRQTSDTAIGIGAQLTAPPFNFEQHAADMIVINAVKYVCPEFQSKIDNPTN